MASPERSFYRRLHSIAHPTKDVLESFANESLRGDAALTLIVHTMSCQKCAKHLRFLQIRRAGPQTREEQDFLERNRGCYD